MKNIVLIFGLLLFIFGCENLAVEPNEIGTIEGKVTIGPLCGTIMGGSSTNPCNLTDEQLNAIYSKYKVVIQSEVGSKLSNNEIILNKTGVFTFEVPVGAYKIEITTTDPNQTSTLFGNADNRIKTINVLKNQKTFLDLTVDTGIR